MKLPKFESFVSTEEKLKWGDGPWLYESDKYQWTDPETGYPLMIIRHENFGHLCGYVGIGKNHPKFNRHYDDVDVDVHGGLTYADKCQGRVCHEVESGEDDEIWWLGFDFAHLGDLSPGISSRLQSVPFISGHPGIYKNVDCVRKECESVAKQLKGMEKESWMKTLTRKILTGGKVTKRPARVIFPKSSKR